MFGKDGKNARKNVFVNLSTQERAYVIPVCLYHCYLTQNDWQGVCLASLWFSPLAWQQTI